MGPYGVNKSLRYEEKRDIYYGRTLSKQRQSSSRRFPKILWKYCKLYCKYTKLAGFKYFVEADSTWFDRTLWFLVYAITMPTMVYTVYCAYLEFMDTPLLTTAESESFPTRNLDFPGVSVCTINRISRQSAMELANEVFAANISYLSFDEILDMIGQLGDLYDSEFQIRKKFYRMDQLLTVYYDGYYNITDVMKRLTPQCSSMLLKCRFHNEDRNCSELFEFRKTQDGFCCTFNYAAKGDDAPLDGNIDSHRVEPIKVQNLTEEGGLALLLEPFLDDYFYPIFPTPGWKMTIFNPYDYPDMTSGGVVDVLISPRTHRSVELDAIIFNSVETIIPYSLDKRHCVFTDELTSLRAFYTYSDCIVDCKIGDMWKICGCIPFFLPNGESRRVCNLEDVPCLSQHKSKWFSVVPHEDMYNDEYLDKANVLHCNNCYPECSDVNYVAMISSSHLKYKQSIAKLLNDVEIKDQAAVTVYFNKLVTTKLRQDVIYRWYELMGNASGICGIFVGFSLIAIVEFAYFVGLFMLELLKGPALSDANEKRTERKQPPIQTIYWGELYSNSRTMENQRDRIRVSSGAETRARISRRN